MEKRLPLEKGRRRRREVILRLQRGVQLRDLGAVRDLLPRRELNFRPLPDPVRPLAGDENVRVIRALQALGVLRRIRRDVMPSLLARALPPLGKAPTQRNDPNSLRRLRRRPSTQEEQILANLAALAGIKPERDLVRQRVAAEREVGGQRHLDLAVEQARDGVDVRFGG